METAGKETQELQEPSPLSFSEVLHLLSRKVILGQGVPEKYNYPPWRLFESHPVAAKINPLLSYSMKVQSGHIPKSDEFSEFILSNSSLAISGLLQYYLSSLGIESNIVFGILQWDPEARSDADDFEGTPHIWLQVDGVPIDNAHVAFPPNADNLEYFFECKKMNSYLAENPVQSKMKLFLGQDSDEDSKEILRHNLRVLQTYSFPGHVEKYLVVSLKNPELNPGLRIYHSLMIEFLKNNFSVSPTSLEEKLAKRCWACNKIFEDSELLKTCTDCKIAKYCNRDCQRQEWKVHRLLHQELEHTRRLLKEEESEIEKEEKEKEQVKQMLQTRC